MRRAERTDCAAWRVGFARRVRLASTAMTHLFAGTLLLAAAGLSLGIGGAHTEPARKAPAAGSPPPEPSRSPLPTTPATGPSAISEPANPAAAADAPSASPAPASSGEEARFYAAMDRLIAPVRDRVPSTADAQRLREAIKAIGSNDLATARRLAREIDEPAAVKLVDWYALRSGIGTPPEFVAFLAANPDWPEADLLHRRAEEQVLSGGGTADTIRQYFGPRQPRTAAGLAALASAHLMAGDEATARTLAQRSWRSGDLPSTFEAGVLQRFGKLLGAADHRRRLDHLLIDEGRFAVRRTDRIAAARRLLPLLSEGERRKAEARIAVYARSPGAARMLAALPAEGAANDWGLQFQLAQQARLTRRLDEAVAIHTRVPRTEAAQVVPDAWWLERRWAAYELIRAGRFKAAYDLVREPGPLTVNPLKDATFLAGWLALRHLKDAKAARKHFEASLAAADGPLSAARAHYWLARTHEALGEKTEARRHFAAATKRHDTFHGALARQTLDPGSSALPIRLPELPSAAVAKAFQDSDLVRAGMLAHHAGLGRGITRIIFAHLRYRLRTEAEVALLAHLASSLGDHQMAVRIGKTAIARDMNLLHYAYPVHPLPHYSPLRRSPERAMLLAIARQESEFNPEIVSHAGARGLLQVMPITARHICRDHKVRCDIQRLGTDPTYNTMIASAYVADRKAELAGSYVLTLVAYNAGPGRARQWMRELGDPRRADVDPIDWIEMIPIEETREYVKKVLSNLQVYRARLGDPRPLRLKEDLHRVATSADPGRAEAAPRLQAAPVADRASRK